MGWEVQPGDYFGFCCDTTPIVAADTYYRPYDSGWGVLDPRGVFIQFGGAPVAKGAVAGNGGDNQKSPDTQLLFSLQIGVQPKEYDVFGYGLSRRYSTDSTDTTACALLDYPRIETVGTVRGFKFYKENLNGEIYFQTYRENAGNYELQQSYLVPRLYNGAQEVNIPDDMNWKTDKGDILAYCYSGNSLTYEFIFNPTRIFSSEDHADRDTIHNTYNTHVLENTPKWIRYGESIINKRCIGVYARMQLMYGDVMLCCHFVKMVTCKLK